MSETTLASAGTGDGPKAATPQALGFWRSMVTGPGGFPDEVAFSYLAAQLVIIAGAVANAFIDRHFALLDFCGAEAALIPLYNAFVAVRGSIGKGQ